METVYSDDAFTSFQSSPKRYIFTNKASPAAHVHSYMGLGG